MQSWFYDLADYSETLLTGSEEITLSLGAEKTGFSRISAGKIRQAGSIEQRMVEVALRSSGRESRMNLMLSGNMESDRAPIRQAIDRLSATLKTMPTDPHLPPLPDSGSGEVRSEGRLPKKSELIQSLAGEIPGAESCGIAMTGMIFRGVATSNAVRRWYESPLTVIDGSMHLCDAPGASKWGWAGSDWQEGEVLTRRDRAQQSLELLSLPLDTPQAGEYRAWLEPAALRDLFGPLLWNGAFSARGIEKGSSPFAPLFSGGQLDQRVHISERPVAVGAPDFGAHGFMIPREVPLIAAGQGVERLTSPRTAMEFNLDSNGASVAETPSALAMQGGEMDPATACERVGDGLWLSHVHYCNMAARDGARVTGVTRWIALRVRDGNRLRQWERCESMIR